MTTNNFLIDFFKPTDKVTVNAVELQKAIKRARAFELQLEKALDREVKLNKRVDSLKQSIQIFEIRKPLHVDLTA